MPNSHTVVIGGGVIGVSTAYFLAKRGRRVTLLEQNDIASGASWGNAGQITPGHLPLPQPGTMTRNLRWLLKKTSPLYIPPRLDFSLLAWLWRFARACNEQHLRASTEMLCTLGRAGIELYDQLAAEIDFGYEKRGRLEVCGTDKALAGARREAKLLGEFGFPHRVLTPSELREMEPAVTGDVAGGVYYADSAHCNPETFVLKLAAAAENAGARVRPNTAVTDIRTRPGRVVRLVTDEEEIEADRLVLACGAWAGPLWRSLGLHLPVQPGKGYHLDLERPARCPKIPIVLCAEKVFIEPLGDFLRLAGTMELSGHNLRQLPARLDMLAAGAARYLSGIHQAGVRSRWCHWRPMSADGLPIIGRVPRFENAWVATGHGMLGLTQGPITGKLLAEWITDGRPGIDLSAVRPDRF